MKLIIKLSMIAMLLVVVTSCKKDKESPSIVISEPANHSEHMMGSEIHIEAVFSDDRDLASYKVYIGTEEGALTPEFDVQYNGTISGKVYEFHEYFMVPTSIEMVYYLHFEVTDAEGKSTTEKVMLHFM